MATTPDVGLGTKIDIAGSTTFFTGVLREITIDGYERSVIDITNMSSTNYREFIPGELVDPGGATCDILFNSGNLAAFKTIAASTKNTVTITYPSQGATAPTFVCAGFVTGFSITSVMDDAMTATVSVKFDGVPTLTSATTT